MAKKDISHRSQTEQKRIERNARVALLRGRVTRGLGPTTPGVVLAALDEICALARGVHR